MVIICVTIQISKIEQIRAMVDLVELKTQFDLKRNELTILLLPMLGRLT